MADEIVLLYEMLNDEYEEELLNCDDEQIQLFGSIIPFMRRDLMRNPHFFEVVVPHTQWMSSVDTSVHDD